MATLYCRNDRHLSEHMLDLMSSDLAQRYRAGDYVMQIRCGTTQGYPWMDWERDSAEADGFATEVRRILASDGFPAADLLRQLWQLLVDEEDADKKRSLLQMLPAERQEEVGVEGASRGIIEAAGEHATTLIDDFIHQIDRQPKSFLSRFAADRIWHLAPGHPGAVNCLFKGLAAIGEQPDTSPDDQPIWNAYIRALVAFSERDKLIVDRLLTMAQVGETDARRGAIRTLEVIGPSASVAIEPLAALIDDRRVSRHAAQALHSIVPLDESRMTELFKRRLTVCGWEDRRILIQQLLERGMTEGEMVEFLESFNAYDRPDDDYDYECDEADDEYDDEDDEFDDYEDEEYDDEAFDDDEEADLGAELRAKLAEYEPETLQLLALSLQQILSEQFDERMEGVNIALALLSGASQDDPDILPNAITAIGEQLPAFPLDEVVIGLVDRLYVVNHGYKDSLDKDGFSSAIADGEVVTTGVALSHVVENLGPRGAAALDRLADYFRIDTEERQLPGIGALAAQKIGPPAARLRDVILDNLFAMDLGSNPDPRMVFLGQHGLTNAHLQKIVDKLQHGTTQQRQTALEVLGHVGAAAAPAYDHVVAAMGAEEENIRQAAPFALAAIGSSRPDTLDHLMRLSRADCESTRRNAAKAFACLDDPPDEVIDRLIEMTKDSDYEVRDKSIESLGKIGKRIDDVVATAADMLGDWNGYDKVPAEYAAEVLEALGPRAAAAVPKIIANFNLDDRSTFGFIDMLAAIGPAAAPAVDRLRIIKAIEPEREYRDDIDTAIRRIWGE